LRFTAAGDLYYVWIDGKLAARTVTPSENRQVEGFERHVPLKLRAGRHDLAVLSAAMGMVKGEWQLRGNMADEKKGLWGPVTWRGRALRGPWTMHPGLVGESARLFAEGAAAVKWTRASKAGSVKPLTWLRAEFARSKSSAPIALDLATMTKGLAWLNGRCIGRYWLVPGVELPSGYLSENVTGVRVGEPTQRYYHLPTEWLADHNVITLFEESGGDLRGVRVVEWR
jgi:beta-galactosidase